MHLPSEEAGRLLRNQLVGVHVYSRTRACLEDVDDHRIIELTRHYLLTRLDDRFAYGAKRSSKRVRRRSEEHTSELQSLAYLVCRLLLEKKKKKQKLKNKSST